MQKTENSARERKKGGKEVPSNTCRIYLSSTMDICE